MMKLELIPVYQHLECYICKSGQAEADLDALWNEYAIKPYWERLSCWAPFDMSDRKPKPVRDIPKLRQQIALLNQMDLIKLEETFIHIMSALPMEGDDTITIAVYPLEDGDGSIKNRQNGVLGTSIFGNILIQVDPLAENFAEWVPYVFAHEYHHSVWGAYWYVNHGGATGQLIESLVIDGQADSFATSLFPWLNPSWLNQIPADKEKQLWNEHYAGNLNSTDYDYGRLMFGDTAEEVPWCAGYSYGYKIVQSYLQHNPGISFKQLLETSAQDI